MAEKSYCLKNGEELIIRKSNPDDAREILEYLNFIGGETDFLTFGLGEFPLNIEDEKKYITQVNNTKNTIHLIGLISGKIVAMLNVSAQAKKRLRHVGEFGMTVAKKHWGKGIGSIFLKYLLEWARENPTIKKINLRVVSTNVKAIRIYEKFGFRNEGVLVKDFYLNGKYHDTYYMGIWLGKE